MNKSAVKYDGYTENIHAEKVIKMRIKAIAMMVFAVLLSVLLTPAFAQPPTFPPGRVLTGGAFWAGSTDSIAFSWVATHPVVYGNDYEGGIGTYYEARNTYGPNIRDFAIEEASDVILEETVTLKNIGVWPYTSYFEIGIGGSLNGYHQYWGSTDGCVYIIIFGNGDGGYDIHIQDYIGHRPAETAIYRTTGIPGEDPVPPATFHFVARFDLTSKLAYLTVEGVSVDSVAFGLLAWGSGTEDFDVPIGVFAGILSVDLDNTGYASISALKVTVAYEREEGPGDGVTM